MNSHKRQFGHLYLSARREIFVLLATLLLLQGCAGAPTKKTESETEKPVEIEASSETRADFKAAMEYIQAEEYDKGIELLKKVAKILPDNAIPQINLALAYKKQDKLKLAEESLKLAIKADPDNPVANNESALLYRKMGRFKEAREVYEQTLVKYPNFNIVHKNLGILCDLYIKDYECAIKHYVIYSNAVQDDKTIKIWIADVQKRLGK